MTSGPEHHKRKVQTQRLSPLGRIARIWCHHQCLFAYLLLLPTAGCISIKMGPKDNLSAYQQGMATRGPQRVAELKDQGSTDPLDVLRPYVSPEREVLPLPSKVDPLSQKQVMQLSLGRAIVMALHNNPSIRTVSFDPEIAARELEQAAAEFDPAAFARGNLDEQDNPVNGIFQPGRSESRSAESGLKQRLPTGTEWSLAYTLAREWDNLFGRTLATRYEPFVVLDLKQPLLRDAWLTVNLAKVNTAKLNHRLAMLEFRQKTNEIATKVVIAYWQLWQARRELQIDQELYHQAVVTLRKVEGRTGIDASDVQRKQAETSMVVREVGLVGARKRIRDAQDALLMLIADPRLNLLSDTEITLTTQPKAPPEILDEQILLQAAMLNNPRLEQARVATEIADLYVRVAENQTLPRLDLVGSTRAQGFGDEWDESHSPLGKGEYIGYAIGLTLEVPLGNRERKAALEQRRIERRKALATLTEAADQVALVTKERMRRVESNGMEIPIYQRAEAAADSHLQAMEQSEQNLPRLTPEFLLVKLQAQESLASARQGSMEAIAQFNISLTELAEVTGSVLELHNIRAADANEL